MFLYDVKADRYLFFLEKLSCKDEWIIYIFIFVALGFKTPIFPCENWTTWIFESFWPEQKSDVFSFFRPNITYVRYMRYGRDMENLTTKERQLFHSLEGFMCMSRNSSATDVYLERFLAVFNFLSSIIASLGNLLILVALPKTCSLHSPSKILYRCLATTDFCVGVVAQPAFAVQLLYNNGERQELCYMSLRLSFCAGVIL